MSKSAIPELRLRQITGAAEQLFSRQGYHATTIRQVAQAVDLQGGSLYAHIASKEDVLAAIVERAADEFQSAIGPIVAEQLPAAERLRRAVRAHIAVIAANPSAATVYFQDWRHLSPARQAAVRRRRDDYERLWRSLVADGLADGSFAGVEPRLAATACLSLCNWTYQWYDPAGSLSPEAIADQFCDLLLRGLQAEPVPTRKAVEP
jgi:AcrR family transcriptional regulator